MTEEPHSDNLPTVFVISPIGTGGSDNHRRFMLSYEYIIKKALPSDVWDVMRGDFEPDPGSITGKIITRIVQSNLIIADLSNHNPNVFYELAVAHGYGKPVIHIMEEGQRPPFDVGDQRVIFYDLTNPASVDKAVRDLRRSAEHAGEEGYTAKNPLTDFELFSEIRSGKTSDDAGPAVADALADLAVQVRRLGRRIDMQEMRAVRNSDARVHNLMRAISDGEQNVAEVTARIHDLRSSPATPPDELVLAERYLAELRDKLSHLRAQLLDD